MVFSHQAVSGADSETCPAGTSRYLHHEEFHYTMVATITHGRGRRGQGRRRGHGHGGSDNDCIVYDGDGDSGGGAAGRRGRGGGAAAAAANQEVSSRGSSAIIASSGRDRASICGRDGAVLGWRSDDTQSSVSVRRDAALDCDSAGRDIPSWPSRSGLGGSSNGYADRLSALGYASQECVGRTSGGAGGNVDSASGPSCGGAHSLPQGLLAAVVATYMKRRGCIRAVEKLHAWISPSGAVGDVHKDHAGENDAGAGTGAAACASAPHAAQNGSLVSGADTCPSAPSSGKTRCSAFYLSP